MPNLANNVLNCCIVAAAVVPLIGNTSKCKSTTRRYIPPSIGPAKSTCSLVHGRLVQHQGRNGDEGGIGFNCSHSVQCFTIPWICWSIFGHHIKLRAKDFILGAPGCPPWSSISRGSLPGGGITTLPPHKLSTTHNLCALTTPISVSSMVAVHHLELWTILPRCVGLPWPTEGSRLVHRII